MPHRPFRNPKYQHVVINFGNGGLPPRTTDGRAAFRVLGGFASPAQARAHCTRRLGAHAQKAFTAVIETHKWYVIPHSVERISTAEAHLKDLLSWHQESIETRQQFKNRIAAERELLREPQGETKNVISPPPPETPVSSPTIDPEPAPAMDVNQEPSCLEEPLTDSMTIRGQHLAIISILQDKGTDGFDEPAVCVWGFAADQQEAEKMMKCVIGHEIRDHDLILVEMYEWVAPHVVNSNEIRTTYRNSEENNILQGLFDSRQNNDPRLRTAQGITITATDIHSDE